jgi:hypothetical protein
VSTPGFFTALCTHALTGDFWRPTESCGKPATQRKYGIFRCDDHVSDLDPANWPNETTEAGGR